MHQRFLALKTESFQLKNFDIFLLFAQNMDCGYTLEPVLTSTHNLMFGAKIREIGIPLQTPVFYIKVGFKGVYMSRTCFPDGVGFFVYFPHSEMCTLSLILN